MDVLSQTDIPAVPTSRYLRVDDASIGHTAARHFLALGNFRSFAYVHDPRGEIWTRERHIAFAGSLAEAKRRCDAFTPDANMPPELFMAELANFLHSLPLPVAVLAANDFVAEAVVRACDAAELSIPEDVAILGVDADVPRAQITILRSWNIPTLENAVDAIGAYGATTKRCRLAWRRSAARKCTAALRPEGRKCHFVP